MQLPDLIDMHKDSLFQGCVPVSPKDYTPCTGRGKGNSQVACACRGQHEAKRLGAALISRNIADILLNHFQEHGKQLKVLVYCWRGGERSQSLAHVLSRVGWQVAIVKRGYMGYRNQVGACCVHPKGSFHMSC